MRDVDTTIKDDTNETWKAAMFEPSNPGLEGATPGNVILVDATIGTKAHATGELGLQPHAPVADSDAKDDLKAELNAPFHNVVEMPDSERSAAKVGATNNVAIDGDVATMIATPTVELCDKHHTTNAKGFSTVNVIVNHILASTDDSKSNNKGSDGFIFTLT